MPSRSESSAPARSTRSASRNKAPSRPSKAVKRPPLDISNTKGNAKRTSRSRVIKSIDRKPASNSGPRSGHGCVKKRESPFIQIKNEKTDDDNFNITSPPQQQQAQRIAGPSYPRPSQAGSWQWAPAEHALSSHSQQGPLPLPQHNQPNAGKVGMTTATPALQELYWQRHRSSFQGVNLETFLYEYDNIQTKFFAIGERWIAAIWQGKIHPTDMEKMALEYHGFASLPQFVEHPSETKYRLLFSGIEIYSITVCRLSRERRLPLHEAFANHRLHILEMLRTYTLDSVIHYHHLFVGQAITYGQDHPERWDINRGAGKINILQRRPSLPAI